MKGVKHDMPIITHCQFCNFGFSDYTEKLQHMRDKHIQNHQFKVHIR